MIKDFISVSLMAGSIFWIQNALFTSGQEIQFETLFTTPSDLAERRMFHRLPYDRLSSLIIQWWDFSCFEVEIFWVFA